ncbi:MAG: hypothetical protein M3O82_09085 [Verrucomicrobiota bacterium]|nr:hypothetical protein [Verrucomicrobiota bacterium]
MKVHTRQIPNGGLHLEGEETDDILDLAGEKIQALGPLRYAVDSGLSGTGLFATGSLELDLGLQCVSCLEEFRYPLEVPDFAMQIELNGAESVDLTPYFREDILLNLPAYPHCDWSGEKVCSGVHGTVAEANGSPAVDVTEAWSELDKLKQKSK